MEVTALPAIVAGLSSLYTCKIVTHCASFAKTLVFLLPYLFGSGKYMRGCMRLSDGMDVIRGVGKMESRRCAKQIFVLYELFKILGPTLRELGEWFFGTLIALWAAMMVEFPFILFDLEDRSAVWIPSHNVLSPYIQTPGMLFKRHMIFSKLAISLLALLVDPGFFYAASGIGEFSVITFTQHNREARNSYISA